MVAAAACMGDKPPMATLPDSIVLPGISTSGSSSSSSSMRHQRGGSSMQQQQVPPPQQQLHAGSEQQQQQPPWLNGAKMATAGGIAGAFAKSCTAPLARLTILYQVQGFSGGASQQQAAAAGGGGVRAPPKLRQAFMQVVRSEGPAALWKGNLVTILHRLPYSSINFWTYEHSNKLLRRHLPPGTDFARTWLSGAVAGLVACSAAYPLDLVRTRLAAQTQGHYYSGILPTLQRIVADEGAAGLYRGLGATLLQVVPSLALNFSLYDTIRSSCMAVYARHMRSQQRLAAAAALAAASDVQAAASGSGSSGSTGHSLAVASSVDQGLSLSQMLLWHLDDEDAAAAADAARSPRQQQRSAEGAAAAAASGSSSSRGAGAQHASSSSSSSSSRPLHAEVPAGISLVSGCVSGFLTATATFPLDVIRRRMQVYGRQHAGQAGGTAVSYTQIMREVTGQGRGLRGFYVGILPEYCKVVPGVAIAFCTYEQLKQWLRVE